MINLGPIYFQIGLPLNNHVDDGQNKFKVHISKNMDKIANFQPKIGQDTNFTPTLNGHNSAISHPILTFYATKMISSTSFR